MKILSAIQESYTELVHKVSWPTWSELQNSAVVVMTATLIISLIVAAMDMTFSRIMEGIYGLFFNN